MEYDLLFAFLEPNEWKESTKTGFFCPNELNEDGYFKCYEGNIAEKVANLNYTASNKLLLLVIDPLRIHEPIKKEKNGDINYYSIVGKFTIDAIIDRITIKKSKKGLFNINIKHFD